ncbi:cell division protein FtsX [Altererythrobacter sp. CAU 1778]
MNEDVELERAMPPTRRLFGRRGRSELIPRARLRGPMPWVMAIMIALTVIATAGGLALGNLAASARAEIENGATVQIIEAEKTERDRQARLALATVKRLPGVAEAVRVPDDELNDLIEPWLGDVQQGEEAIPVPAIIDVRFSGEAGERRLELLRDSLDGVAPAARIDAQASWLEPVFETVSSLRWLAMGLVVLLGLTTVAAVLLSARSALGGNRDTIEIVHLLGGTDSQIARVFGRSIAIDAIIGGVVGLLLGGAVVLALGSQFNALNSGVVSGGGLEWLDWLAIAAIPVVGVLLAMITARSTVMVAVRRML